MSSLKLKYGTLLHCDGTAKDACLITPFAHVQTGFFTPLNLQTFI